MIEQLARFASPILEFALVRRVRRNHGFEHATIHMLSRRNKGLRVAGRADNGGFYLYGELDTDAVWVAAEEALQRMRDGESKWAIHPNCGTMLVTTSMLTSWAALFGLVGTRNSFKDTMNRLPLVMLLSIVALLVSQPVGLEIQKHITTSGEPGDLEIERVTQHEAYLPFAGRIMVHRVHTRNG